MLLDTEHTGCIVQLLADVFADAFELTTTLAMRVLRFVPYECTRQLSWQCHPLGLRFGFVVDRLIFDQICPLLFDGAGVGIDDVLKQTALQ